MRKLLATTAISLVTLTGAASAQSVLERVLGTIDASVGGQLGPVNGTFANIAENIGGVTTPTSYVGEEGNDVGTTPSDLSTAGEQYTADEYAKILATQALAEELLVTDTTAAPSIGDPDPTPEFTYTPTVGLAQSFGTEAEALAASLVGAEVITSREFIIVEGIIAEGIDGSITNAISGVMEITQDAIANNVSATEFEIPLFNFGDMAVTALGAVNTGDIALGVNQATDEARTKSTEAISTVMAQLGGSVDTGSIVLNVASNMTGINGSITNTMGLVNGMTGALSTTALGAVNTGKIINGIDSAVDGIIGVSGS